MSATITDEVEVLSRVLGTLNETDERTAIRIVRWLMDRYSVSPSSSDNRSKRGLDSVNQNSPDASARDGDLPSLFAATSPATGSEKALVAAYWLQTYSAQSELDAQTINNELKNLGHGIGNITKALTDLIRQRPQPVIQTRKSGRSKQARKTYRVTDAGSALVRAWLQKGNAGATEPSES